MSQTDSLVRRLAGPSTGKAGVKQDQTEINRIIAEASKGSKFYENEKRKDKELTEKIEKLLKMRDDLMKSADIEKLEAAADKQIEELEASRDLSQSIVHVDLDSFYASVEILDDPSLKGKAFGVGYGVLSTASYEARKFGVRSAMPGFIAKKLCPELIFVPGHYNRYAEMSNQVMDILRDYDPNMAIGGADEAYLNITEYCKEHDLAPIDCVSAMRARVFEETKLTISAGLAPNTMLAKICSDRNKPNGQYHLPSERQAVLEFVLNLSIRKIPGIGRITERLLDSIGIKTCGDVYTHRAVVSLMDHYFHLCFLLKCYLGLGSTVVEPGKREGRKSVGVETTFHAISDEKKLLEKLSSVATDLEEDLERTGWAGKTITLKYKLDNYQVFTRAKSMPKWITTKEDLFEIGRELLMAEMPLKLRLIGLRATQLKDLRADPNKGIKRFFKDQSSASNKKAKISHDEEEDDEIQEIFFRPDDHDDVLSQEIEEVENPVQQQGGAASAPVSKSDEGVTPSRWARYDPPNSKNSLATSSTSKAPHSKQMRLQPVKVTQKARDPNAPVKPKPAPKRPLSVDRSAAPGAPVDKLRCPICSCLLETDNAGLNSHIDWCLSRGEIKRASAG